MLIMLKYFRLLLLWALTLLIFTARPAAASEVTTTNGLTVDVDAVDRDIFHVVVYPAGTPAPPASPFVVETSAWPGAVDRIDSGGATARTPSGMLGVSAGGAFELRGKSDTRLLSGTVDESNGSITLTLSHDPSDRLYGAGNAGINHAGDLTHPSEHQYVGNGCTRIPFLWATSGWSLLVANDQTGSVWNDDHGKLTWTMPGPYVDLYLSIAPDGYGLLDRYSRLTGRAPIPPRWSMGFMISRWGYDNAADIQDKWHQFRDRQIPVDAFIYDYDWFHNDWEFDPNNFPDPKANLAEMHKLGLRFVGIRKPRVNGDNLDYARLQGWTMRSPQGADLRFDIPEARYWWWSKQVPLVEAGVDGWWNDEAEQTSDEFFHMTQAEYEGGRAASDERVWSISRGFAPGMQRFGSAVWTGDINSDWQTLQNQPGTMLNWSLAGMPFVGQDVGGFQGLPEPELYARWIEESVYVPVMRAHGTLKSDRWPWAFGDDVLAATKKAIELRYRLIPYLYTVAKETSTTGAPMMRPLFMEFPADANTFDMEDEWLVGARLLAAPILTKGGTRDVYLPAGAWYDFNTGAKVDGGATLHVTAPLNVIPAYVRAGSIVTLGPVIQSTALGVEDPLEIRVYPGADANFDLYEDDGTTYAYEKGASSSIPMRWDDVDKTLTLGDRKGSFAGMLPTRHVDVVLPDGSSQSVTYTGKKTQVKFR